ncbi:nitric oxide-sensing protein NosP [Shewanella sp. NIFS-20-20]|uniref:nitric oxide-sensing protein NosP n=1 Tax=Shewanella sp. NIFS-20-20 TaxID=2853806 RepID=UPI001C48B978|nr:nitric oxide-sensing protein NosP [Shewanella sp. NIFS-20-20]MBV7315365.1 FIST C-terminal domain-containing protein [Shewanella sp. NIFS-20-20]
MPNPSDVQPAPLSGRNPPDALILLASSDSTDADVAAAELAQQFQDQELAAVLFFCSASYDLPALAAAMNLSFADYPLMGCTTSGELTDTGYHKNSILALGFKHSDFCIEAALMPLASVDLVAAQACVTELMQRCQPRLKGDISQHSFVLTMVDGLSPKEELFLAMLNSALGKIPHFGGSAGDDVILGQTHVYLNGEFHSDAAIVVMVNTHCPFTVFTTHHIESLQRKLVVTRADSQTRRVYELNAEPAALVYAREVGIAADELRPEVYALHPLAVLIGDEYYVRSIQKVNEDLSIDFYCAVDVGIVLTAMQPGDIYSGVATKLASVAAPLGEVEMVLACDCFLRELEIRLQQGNERIQRIFNQYRVLGFNTYGEQLNGIHMNQTFTGVMIAKPKPLAAEAEDC